MMSRTCSRPLLFLFFAEMILLSLSVFADAVDDEVTPCSVYDNNPNSDDIPMVSPPKEVVGMWNGTNCGLNDPSPTPADLSMYPNGTNIWYFNNVPQTGDGVEVVIGWNCLEQKGTGYWWGQTADSTHFWCNLFQVDYDELSRQATYTNYAIGGEGQFAQASEGCPTSLVDLPTDTLQATFQRTLDEDEIFVFTCLGGEEEEEEVTTSKTADDKQSSCRSQFQNDKDGQKVVVPDPFEDGKLSLPIIDATSCQAIDSSDNTPSSGGAAALTSTRRYYLDLFLLVVFGAYIGAQSG